MISTSVQARDRAIVRCVQIFEEGLLDSLEVVWRIAVGLEICHHRADHRELGVTQKVILTLASAQNSGDKSTEDIRR